MTGHDQFSFRQIGTIHTGIYLLGDVPIQSSRSDIAARVEIFPEFAEGLLGVEEFSHIYLLYIWHKSVPNQQLTVTPFLDDREHGVFATRFPSRPNPLGISLVRLLRREGNILHIRGADMLDGTPVIDIKPYVSEFDQADADRFGWYTSRKFK